MGDHEVEIQGFRLKVKLIDSAGVLNQLIPTYFNKDDILGLDLKRITPTTINNSELPFEFSARNSETDHVSCSSASANLKVLTNPKCDLLYGSIYELLILCGASRCLIIHLRYMNNQVPESLKNFLQNSEICFVRMPKMVTMCSNFSWVDGVEADDLAARVLKKPSMKGLSLGEVARTVGVPYKDVNGSSRDQSGVVQVVSKYVRVLAPDQVKMVMNDAYTCYYKIGSMLLNSL